jgi:hypothetical protein
MHSPKSKLLKSSNLAAIVEEDCVYKVLCKNIHGQEFTLSIESTLADAETFKNTWIETHSNRYWCKNGNPPDVYFQKKIVMKGEL